MPPVIRGGIRHYLRFCDGTTVERSLATGKCALFLRISDLAEPPYRGREHNAAYCLLLCLQAFYFLHVMICIKDVSSFIDVEQGKNLAFLMAGSSGIKYSNIRYDMRIQAEL